MAQFLPYMIKVMLISAILVCYYWFALRDRSFHRFNRFFLLMAVIVPLVLPLIRFDFLFTAEGGTLPYFVQRDVVMDAIVISAPAKQTTETRGFFFLAYAIPACVMLLTFLFTLARIFYLRFKNHSVDTDGSVVVWTTADGTPFSFFHWIFLHPDQNYQTGTYQRIIRHEMAHVKQLHSLDKIFINIVLIFCWFNPFVWIIRKELNMVHEFLADQFSFQDDDGKAFSKLALHSIYPDYRWPITNNLFHSPIKRRLAMIIKSKHPKHGYVRRIMMLPIAAILLFVFSTKAGVNPHLEQTSETTMDTIPNNKIKRVEGIPADHTPRIRIISDDGETETITVKKAKERGLLRAPIIPPAPPAPPAPPSTPKQAPTAPVSAQKIFTKVDKPAEFPGGNSAWQQYIRNAITPALDKFTDADFGTVLFKFIVEADGTVKNVEATTMKQSKLAEVGINAIRKGPKWIPAEQNGQNVAAFRIQPVTLKNPKPDTPLEEKLQGNIPTSQQ